MIDAMKMALEVLERASDAGYSIECEEAITDLRQAIAEAEKQAEFDKEFAIYAESDEGKARSKQAEKQEPVAYRKEAHGMWFYIENKPSPPNDDYEPLYTAPPKSENKLDIAERAYFAGKQAGIAESDAVKREWVGLTDDEVVACWARPDIFSIAHAIEAKLKERNT